jgi:hypothetical protein
VNQPARLRHRIRDRVNAGHASRRVRRSTEPSYEKARWRHPLFYRPNFLQKGHRISIKRGGPGWTASTFLSLSSFLISTDNPARTRIRSCTHIVHRGTDHYNMRRVPHRMEPWLSRLPFRSRRLRCRPRHRLAKSRNHSSRTSRGRDDTFVPAATDAALTPIAVLVQPRQEQRLPLSVPPLPRSSSIPL